MNSLTPRQFTTRITGVMASGPRQPLGGFGRLFSRSGTVQKSKPKPAPKPVQRMKPKGPTARTKK